MSAHADRRLGYIRGLWSVAERAGCASHRAKQWQHLCTVMCKILLCESPLPSRHAVTRLVQGVGADTEQALREIEESKPVCNPPHVASGARRVYCSPAAALLVALLEYDERERATSEAADATVGSSSVSVGEALCPRLRLIELAAALCELPFRSRALHEAAIAQGAPPPPCAALQQMSTLLTLQYVRDRKRKKMCESGVVYHLTQLGRSRARALRRNGELGEDAPLRRHLPPRESESRVVYLLVDEREGGGQSRDRFYELLDALESRGVRFETRRLKSGYGDYHFVLKDGSGHDGSGRDGRGSERGLPRIIERKAYEDVAHSLKDGRWEKQQEAMRRVSAAHFGGDAQLEYVIEGGDRADLFHECPRCAPRSIATRGVGGCPKLGFPTRVEVEAALSKLEDQTPTAAR